MIAKAIGEALSKIGLTKLTGSMSNKTFSVATREEEASEIQNLVFFNRVMFYFRKLAKLFKLTGSKAKKVISSYLQLFLVKDDCSGGVDLSGTTSLATLSAARDETANQSKNSQAFGPAQPARIHQVLAVGIAVRHVGNQSVDGVAKDVAAPDLGSGLPLLLSGQGDLLHGL
jgi:hypothetical protein